MTRWTGTFDLVNQSTQPPGFEQARAPGGQLIDYWYRFGGGSDGKGGMTVSKSVDGDSNVALTFLDAAAGYQDAAKTNVNHSLQFSWTQQTVLGVVTVTIYDKVVTFGGGEGTTYYTILVKDARAGKNGQLVICDPTIKDIHRPKTGEGTC